eukprot:764368-Hanusia_phi.AAC.4
MQMLKPKASPPVDPFKALVEQKQDVVCRGQHADPSDLVQQEFSFLRQLNQIEVDSDGNGVTDKVKQIQQRVAKATEQ